MTSSPNLSSSNDSVVGTSRADLDAEAVPLKAALAERLAEEGLLHDPAWRQAVQCVPRHRFVPGFYADGGRSDGGMPVWEPVTPDTDARRWLSAAYSDTTLITQFDGIEADWNHPVPHLGGAPTSSSTLPSLVVQMWNDADIHDGHDVLEIGTGTGYSTALACERLEGTGGNVASVEVDPYRLDQAAAALFACGYGPDLAVADGLYGYWPSAPYDRIVAACSTRDVPAAWLAQAKPGGRILTTLSGWLYGYARVLLTVTPDPVTGEPVAEGPLLPGTISFMAARTHDRPAPGNPAHWASLTRDAAARPVRHSPDRLEEPTAEGFFGRFLAQLAAPNAQLATEPGERVDQDGRTRHLIDVTSGSVATLTRDSSSGYAVRQAGPTPLWDAVEDAWDAWDAADRPGPEEFRMCVQPGRQTVAHPGTPRLNFTLPRT